MEYLEIQTVECCQQRLFENLKSSFPPLEDGISFKTSYERKLLYAVSYYPEDEFWQIYSRKDYEELRKKYHADGTLVDITKKVLKPMPEWKRLAPNFKVLSVVLYSILALVLVTVCCFIFI